MVAQAISKNFNRLANLKSFANLVDNSRIQLPQAGYIDGLRLMALGNVTVEGTNMRARQLSRTNVRLTRKLEGFHQNVVVRVNGVHMKLQSSQLREAYVERVIAVKKSCLST